MISAGEDTWKSEYNMSDIVFICECGKIYHFHKRFAGRTSRCINCRRDYVVPLISEQSAPPSHDDEKNLEDFIVKAVSSEHDTSGGPSDSTVVPLLVAAEEHPPPLGITKRTDETPVLQKLGRYEIYEKIGSGGMGNVYFAWDTQLKREVTIKTTNTKSRRHDNYKERFINEARIAGKLVHSGIITIYSLDYDDAGEPYYSMRLLEGRTLEQLTAQYHNLNSPTHTSEQLRKLIRHFIDVCQTMAYAHDNNVVHRDIKPANIMLGGYGETVVLDWGLAKTISGEKNDEEDLLDYGDVEKAYNDQIDELNDEDAPDLTMLGARVGTVGYQSPEYLRGDDSQPSDDLYALGVTLYCILCNKLPYVLPRERRGVYEMMMVPPKLPHLINHHVNRPLSAICLCALAFDKSNRYPTAAHLAADLQRWLDGEPVSVYRMNTREKIFDLLRRRATWLIGFFVTFLLGFLVAWLMFGR